MTHAFFWLPRFWQWIAFIICFVLMLSLMTVLSWQGKPLGAMVPGGIGAFELAWTKARAQAILDSWSELGDAVARQRNFPRRRIAASLIETEVRLLPWLSERVPLPIPNPCFVLEMFTAAWLPL